MTLSLLLKMISYEARAHDFQIDFPRNPNNREFGTNPGRQKRGRISNLINKRRFLWAKIFKNPKNGCPVSTVELGSFKTWNFPWNFSETSWSFTEVSWSFTEVSQQVSQFEFIFAPNTVQTQYWIWRTTTKIETSPKFQWKTIWSVKLQLKLHLSFNQSFRP